MDAELEAKLAQLTGLGQGQLLELVLVGGPVEARALLERVKASVRRKGVLLYHQADNGERWGASGLGSKPLGKHLAYEPLRGPASAAELESFARRLVEMEKQAAVNADEMSVFAARVREHRPIGTWALAAVIALVFGLQVLFDGADTSTPVLVRMGALVPERVLQGEWWRLLSSSFLHGGFVHFALNTYVLIVVGSSIERVLGRARFFAIYGISGLVASLIALVASKAGLTVGASGAIWGLLAAESVLVLRPKGLLPAVVQQRSRKSVVINLVINASVSFMPNVAMAAHFGGAAAGALLMLPGFFLRGVPTIEQLRRGGAEARLRTPAWLHALALANVALLAVSLVAGIGEGKAWSLRSAPVLTRRVAGTTGLSADLPVLLQPEPGASSEDGARLAYFGSVVLDPAAVVVSAVDFPDAIPEGQMEPELEALRKALGKAPEGMAIDVQPEQQQIGGHPGVTVRYRAENGLKLEIANVVMPDRLWKIELVYWPQYAPQYAGLAAKIAGSLEATGAPRQPAAAPAAGQKS
jgi:membrane associated rhomboid family serine protease